MRGAEELKERTYVGKIAVEDWSKRRVSPQEQERTQSYLGHRSKMCEIVTRTWHKLHNGGGSFDIR